MVDRVTDKRIAVRAADLSLAYTDGRAAVSGATFEIPVGGILGVVGEAGSGKSTLARAVAAQTLPGEGEAPHITGGLLEVLGEELRSTSSRRMDRLSLKVGYLPQDGGS